MFDFNILTLFSEYLRDHLLSSSMVKTPILQAGQKGSVARHRKKRIAKRIWIYGKRKVCSVTKQMNLFDGLLIIPVPGR
jgi:hypothetical protein